MRVTIERLVMVVKTFPFGEGSDREVVMVVKTFPFGEGSDREVGDGSENVSIW